MTFHDWIYSRYPENAVINGRWGPLHIAVVATCIAIIIAIAFLRKKDEKVRQRVIQILAVLIFAFEIARRIINMSKGYTDPLDIAHVLLPRPWCAISCWMVMAASLVKNRNFYSFSAMNALLNALVFFAYPNVGFNHSVILFENLYSISTHALLLIASVSMMTLGLTDFRYEKKTIIPMALMLLGVFAYSTFEILMGIEPDPLMFMPGSEVQDFLGVEYGPFLVIYVVFLTVYFNAFFLVQKWIESRKAKQLVPV